MWYQKWIPYFEVKVQPLREITNTNEWDGKIVPELWTKDAEDAWNFVIEAIVSNPCLARWDLRYRFYIQRLLYQGHGFCRYASRSRPYFCGDHAPRNRGRTV